MGAGGISYVRGSNMQGVSYEGFTPGVLSPGGLSTHTDLHIDSIVSVFRGSIKVWG